VTCTCQWPICQWTVAWYRRRGQCMGTHMGIYTRGGCDWAPPGGIWVALCRLGRFEYRPRIRAHMPMAHIQVDSPVPATGPANAWAPIRAYAHEAGAIGPRRMGFGWLCAVWVDLSTARAYAHMGHVMATWCGAHDSPVPATGPMHRHPYGHMHTRRVRLGPAGWDLDGFFWGGQRGRGGGGGLLRNSARLGSER
jgi:hypothetical protein